MRETLEICWEALEKAIDKDAWNSFELGPLPCGAETLGDGLVRTKKALDKIWMKYGDKDVTILIVTHNFICKCIWMVVNGVYDKNEINKFLQGHEEIKEYDIGNSLKELPEFKEKVRKSSK